VAIGMQKLAAGSGYEYLTQQVAALDAEPIHGSLAAYYSSKGESPGERDGGGLEGVGVRHVEVRGLIAAVFVHRDSRAGDPNLHTHVAIANKVQTLTGDWLTIDAQVLYRAKVSLSETYTPIAGTPDGAGSVVRGDRRTRSATASPTSSRANQRDLPPGKRTNPPNGIVQNTPNLRHRWNRPAAARASAGDQPTRP